ncbi:hypothetical protein TARUN_8737 [Trichoderma arundinaceum]|uniref:Uncharacterized protein n=1 Tax=Trichoderma arundinaceum TaxID=490622 RepID=A0A395NCR3_TRIAR|nr:hypothetical protein TARUN_8737 [Trichoderma arundinaceum]
MPYAYENRLVSRSTNESSVVHKRRLLIKLTNACDDYNVLRKTLKKHAPLATRKYLEQALASPAPPKDPEVVDTTAMDIDGPVSASPVTTTEEQVDSANANALTVPWDSLHICQYIKHVKSMVDDKRTEAEIFAVIPTAYEAWKMQKEYADIRAGKEKLELSLKAIEKDHECRGPYGVSIAGRARRLRSGGYASSLGEVTSIDENWPQGWALGRKWLPGVRYDTRFMSKVGERPFLLGSDATDCSGILSRRALRKQEGGW